MSANGRANDGKEMSVRGRVNTFIGEVARRVAIVYDKAVRIYNEVRPILPLVGMFLVFMICQQISQNLIPEVIYFLNNFPFVIALCVWLWINIMSDHSSSASMSMPAVKGLTSMWDEIWSLSSPESAIVKDDSLFVRLAKPSTELVNEIVSRSVRRNRQRIPVSLAMRQGAFENFCQSRATEDRIKIVQQLYIERLNRKMPPDAWTLEELVPLATLLRAIQEVEPESTGHETKRMRFDQIPSEALRDLRQYVEVLCSQSNRYALSALHEQLWIISCEYPREMISFECPSLVALRVLPRSTSNNHDCFINHLKTIKSLLVSTDADDMPDILKHLFEQDPLGQIEGGIVLALIVTDVVQGVEEDLTRMCSKEALHFLKTLYRQ